MHCLTGQYILDLYVRWNQFLNQIVLMDKTNLNWMILFFICLLHSFKVAFLTMNKPYSN